MTLTREQIAGAMNSSPVYDTTTGRWARAVKTEYLDALCEMALGYLAMQPRPIEEAPKDRRERLLVFQDCGQPTVIAHWVPEYGRVMEIGGGTLLAPTNFIPLSSLPKVKP